MAVSICWNCTKGDHAACEPVAVARDRHTGDVLTTKAGFTDCRCLCDPRMLRTLKAIDRAKMYVEGGELNMARNAIASALILIRAQMGKEKEA